DHDSLQRKLGRSQNQLKERERRVWEYENGRRQPPSSRQAPPAPRSDAPAPAPAATPAEAKAWEAFKAQFPDEAKAYEERIATTEAALGRKMTEVEKRLERIAEIEKELGPIKDFAARQQAREHEEHKAEGRGYFDQAVPNWEYLAGWKDA